MFAAADPNAVSVRVLSHAECRYGFASCTLALGSRPLVARSALHPADHDCCHDVFHAAHDSPGRHGSGATEDDEFYDARHAGIHELYAAGRPEFVLGHGAGYW